MKIKIILMVIAPITLTTPMIGMKNTITKNFKNMKNLNIKNKDATLLPKAPIAHKKNFSNYSTNIKFSNNLYSTPIQRAGKIWNSNAKYYTSDNPMKSEIDIETFSDDDIANTKNDINKVLENIKSKYAIDIVSLKKMIEAKDPVLEQYNSDFFDKRKELFHNDLNQANTMMEDKLELIKDNKQKRDLIKYWDDNYTKTKSHTDSDLSQAVGFVNRYQRNKETPRETFGQRWKRRLSSGTGYLKAKFDKRMYSTSKEATFSQSARKRVDRLIQEDPFKNIDIKDYLAKAYSRGKLIEGYIELDKEYGGKRTLVGEEEGVNELYTKYTDEKREKLMNVINDNPAYKEPIDDYRHTITLTYDHENSPIKPLTEKITSLMKNAPNNDTGIHAYMARIDHSHSVFHNFVKWNQNDKPKILAARIYLLANRLQQGLDSIDLHSIEENPFYDYTKYTFLKYSPYFIEDLKDKFSQSFGALKLYTSYDELIKMIEDTRWNSSCVIFTAGPQSSGDSAQDLLASTFMEYVLYYGNGYTTEKFVQFYAFLNKMKTDTDYRAKQLQALRLDSAAQRYTDRQKREKQKEIKEAGGWLRYTIKNIFNI